MNFFKKLLLPLVLLGATLGFAQDELQIPGPYSTTKDGVNVATTGVAVAIPIYSKSGRGLSFEYSLYFYNPLYSVIWNGTSDVWQEVAKHRYFINGNQYGQLPLAGSIGGIGLDPPTWRPGDPMCSGLPNNHVLHYDNISFQDRHGSQHALGGNLYIPNTCGYASTATVLLKDGSGLTWKADTSTPNFNGGSVTYPDGTVYNQDGGQTEIDSNG